VLFMRNLTRSRTISGWSNEAMLNVPALLLRHSHGDALYVTLCQWVFSNILFNNDLHFPLSFVCRKDLPGGSKRVGPRKRRGSRIGRGGRASSAWNQIDEICNYHGTFIDLHDNAVMLEALSHAPSINMISGCKVLVTDYVASITARVVGCVFISKRHDVKGK